MNWWVLLGCSLYNAETQVIYIIFFDWSLGVYPSLPSLVFTSTPCLWNRSRGNNYFNCLFYLVLADHLFFSEIPKIQGPFWFYLEKGFGVFSNGIDALLGKSRWRIFCWFCWEGFGRRKLDFWRGFSWFNGLNSFFL